ncbi:MAG: GNAT family N-acetyltransferase [Clostridia bacterium]|nr:GNAT family N-acetyltransferase [Clostridia bacterium]
MNADIDISGVVLRTPRLVLRPWRETDLEDFYEYASVDGVGQMAGWSPHKSIDESRAILSRFIEGKKTFALEKDGRVIGSLGIEKYREELYPEFADKKCRMLGFVLAKPYWGLGLMPEAVNEVIRYLFEDIGLDVIFCAHFLSNTRSARVQEKCGFRHYAFSQFETHFGTVEEDETNILTREDWIARRTKSI